MQANARDLSGKRGDNLLFSGISFSLAAGEGLVVTGPNGVGKSTLLRILAGLIAAESGEFAVIGADGANLPVAEAVHYLGHRNAMKRDLTVEENLEFWKRFQASGNDDGLDVAEAIDAVGLWGIGHLPFGYLSAGQQRRIALARLMLVHRPVWILDEPTAALDKASDRLFADLAARHLAAGGILIAATHLPLVIAGVRTLEMAARVSADTEAWT